MSFQNYTLIGCSINLRLLLFWILIVTGFSGFSQTMELQPISGSPFCGGSAIIIRFTVTGTFNDGNVFTVQLSDANGDFSNPSEVGFTISNFGDVTLVGALPADIASGSGYRIRLVSSDPIVIGPPNDTDLVINETSYPSTDYGDAVWNARVYSDDVFTNYAGYFTENNLNISTNRRYDNYGSPADANTRSGQAYTGCPIDPNIFSISFKRTNFTCGYYQIDILSYENYVELLIDENPVFSGPYTWDEASATSVWSGYLGPNSLVEFRLRNVDFYTNLRAFFTLIPNPLALSPNVSICPGASTTLTASSPTMESIDYIWDQDAGIGSSVTVSPTVTTLFNVTGTDQLTGCSATGSVLVTVSDVFTTSVFAGPPTVCSGNATTLIASGANQFTWSPSDGLSATTGAIVWANPTVTTTYTVTGDNGCTTNTATVTIDPPTPTIAADTPFGNGFWYAYVYNSRDLTNYSGFFTENNLNIYTPSRFSDYSPPSLANGSSGLPYNGCPVSTSPYSLSYKRTNFSCGYYQFYVPYFNNLMTILIDGVEVYNGNSGTRNGNDQLPLVKWSGFLGPTSTVEIQLVNTNTPVGYIEVYISNPDPLSLNAANSISSSIDHSLCRGNTTTLTVSSSEPLMVDYTWNPGSITGASVTVKPSTTTTYTVTGVNPATGCSVSKSIVVSVSECSALPVELVNFYAVAEKAINLLQWVTSSEENCDYFEIQRSPDGLQFYSIGKMTGNGTTKIRNEYTYKDQTPLPGISYYRLRQVDTDLKYTFSEVISVEREINMASIFPNPVSRLKPLYLVCKDEVTTIQLVDILGNKRYGIKYEPSEVGYQIFWGDDVLTGIYLLIVNFSDRRSVFKVVIN